jgi:hypothetical protein
MLEATLQNCTLITLTKDVYNGKSEIKVNIQGVPGVKVMTSGFNSRADSESKTSYTHGPNSQRFWS